MRITRLLCGYAVCCLAINALAAAEFKVIGYFPSYRGTPTNAQLAQLTHIMFSFGTPTAQGGLNPGFNNLAQLTAAAHAQGTKVGLAIGGGGYGDGVFPQIAASPSLRATFVQACMDAIETYNLDGIDLDWEYPNRGAEAQGFALLMSELAEALHARGKFLSSAVTHNDWPGSIGVGSSVLDDVDFLNIMIYDMGNPHSPYSAAVGAIETWCTEIGLAPEKFMLGVPFYSNNPAVLTFAQIISQNPAAAQQDGVGGYDYNSIPTIVQKTELALAQVGGIMIWEIGQDASGSASLLAAIHNTASNAITATAPHRGAESSRNAPVIAASKGQAVKLRLATSGEYTLTAHSPTGSAVFACTRRLTSGEQHVKLPNSLPSGFYVVALSSPTGTAIGKLVIP